MPKTVQFYGVWYKTRAEGFNKYTTHNVYERGRQNLMKLVNELLTHKDVSEFRVLPMSRESVPTYVLTDLEVK